MNAVDERSIREQLERALAPLDPAAPPLDTLRAQAARRRRFRYSIGAGLTTVAAGIVVAVLIVVPGGKPKSVVVGNGPARDSLAAFAAAQHGKHLAGPIESSSGYYGAFTVKKGIQVARYAAGAWRLDGDVITKYGPGRWVVKMSDGGGVIPGRPSFQMRYQGGDVSYFGGVFFLADENSGHATWRAARFGRCNLKKVSCYYPGETQPYGHVVDGVFTSIHNDCTPYCAAGTDYRFTWKWDSPEQRFTVATHHAITG